MGWVKNIARWSIDYMGVNLDYNFKVKWKKRYNYNEDTYPGIEAFSEAESKTLKNYINQVKDYVEMVIIFKSPANKRYDVNFTFTSNTKSLTQFILFNRNRL